MSAQPNDSHVADTCPARARNPPGYHAQTKFRADLRATKRVVLADGRIAEEPVMLITPRDLALLIDRFQILFGRPALITEGRSFAATVTSEAMPLDALQKIVELTRGLLSRMLQALV